MYALRSAVSSIARNKLLAFVALGVMVVSVFVLGLFLVITLNVQGLLSQLKEKVEIRAFLLDDLSQEAIADAKKRIEKIEGVGSVAFVSKDQAYAKFKEELRGRSDLLEAVDANPLPASFEVRLLPEYRTGERASDIASEIERIKGVEEAEYGKEWVGKLDDAVKILLAVDATVGTVIALSCLFLVFNTIRLTVFTRREEIEIMSLVGATDGFIRRPYLLVGLFYGVAGGAIASALLYGLNRALSVKIPAIAFLEPSYLGGLLLFAALLGYFGSLFSVRKFLVS